MSSHFNNINNGYFKFDFEFVPGKLYLNQRKTRIFDTSQPRRHFGHSAETQYREIWLNKKQVLLLQDMVVEDKERKLRSIDHHPKVTWQRIKLFFSKPEDPQINLLWDSGLLFSRFVYQFDNEKTWRAAYSIFRPLEYHKRYTNFWKKRLKKDS